MQRQQEGEEAPDGDGIGTKSSTRPVKRKGRYFDDDAFGFEAAEVQKRQRQENEAGKEIAEGMNTSDNSAEEEEESEELEEGEVDGDDDEEQIDSGNIDGDDDNGSEWSLPEIIPL